MLDHYICPKCFHKLGDSVDVYSGLCSECGVDLSKYSMKFGKDTEERVTIEEFLEDLYCLVHANVEIGELVDYIDKNFLWGAWGFIVGKSDVNFIKDLRGMIVAACELGYKKINEGIKLAKEGKI